MKRWYRMMNTLKRSFTSDIHGQDVVVTIPLDRCKDLYFAEDGMLYIESIDTKIPTTLPLRDKTFWVHRMDPNSLRVSFRQKASSVVIVFQGESTDIDRLVQIVYDYATNYKDPWIDQQFLTDKIVSPVTNVIFMDNYRYVEE